MLLLSSYKSVSLFHLTLIFILHWIASSLLRDLDPYAFLCLLYKTFSSESSHSAICHFYPICTLGVLGSLCLTLTAVFHSRDTFASTSQPAFPLLWRLHIFTICVNIRPLCLNKDAPLCRFFSPEASRESCVPHPLTDRGAVLLQGDDGLGLVRPGGGRGSGVVFLEEIWFFHILLERWVGLCPMGSGDHVDL